MTDADRKKYKCLHVYTDGGSRGNPGLSAVGYVICNTQNEILDSGGMFLDEFRTNNQAEYEAVIHACGAIGAKYTVDHVRFFSDSKLVVNQINGRWRSHKMHLSILRSRVAKALQPFKTATFKWVTRNHVRIRLADAIVNKKIDEYVIDNIQ